MAEINLYLDLIDLSEIKDFCLEHGEERVCARGDLSSEIMVAKSCIGIEENAVNTVGIQLDSRCVITLICILISDMNPD